MALDDIEKLLEAYFEGATNLEEESILMEYFNTSNVAEHLLPYKPIFVGLKAMKNEESTRDFSLPKEESGISDKFNWYWIAVLLVIALGAGLFYSSQSRISQEERNALTAFENSRKAMIMLSENFNKGAEQINYVDQFTIAKEKVFVSE